MENTTAVGLSEALVLARSLVSCGLAEPDLALLTDASVLELLTVADQAVSVLQAARAEVIREVVCREAAENEAHCVPAEFLHRGLGHTIQTCRTIIKDAVRQGRHPNLVRAVAAGEVQTEQATAIGRALELFPDDLGTQILSDCEASLIEAAATLDPAELQMVAWRVLEHVAPERADEILADKLEREEKAARKNRRLSLKNDGHGTMHVKGRLPSADGEELEAILKAHAESIWKRQVDAEAGEGAPRDQGQLMADALMAVVRSHQTHRAAPTHGGDRPRVILLLGLTALLDGLGPMTLGSGTAISAAEARRLACDCDLIPAVLDANGIPLDLGRSERLVTPSIRAALVARDRGCIFPGCDRGHAESEAHHWRPWWAGGPTSLPNLMMLCPRHHRKVEPGRDKPWDFDDPDRWQARFGDDGIPEIIPPRGYDPDRTVMRHARFGLLRP